MGYRQQVAEMVEEAFRVVEDETIPEDFKLSSVMVVLGKIRWIVGEREVEGLVQEEMWGSVNGEERDAEF